MKPDLNLLVNIYNPEFDLRSKDSQLSWAFIIAVIVKKRLLIETIGIVLLSTALIFIWLPSKS
jgi:Zn-dependent membrane protease YugP